MQNTHCFLQFFRSVICAAVTRPPLTILYVSRKVSLVSFNVICLLLKTKQNGIYWVGISHFGTGFGTGWVWSSVYILCNRFWSNPILCTHSSIDFTSCPLSYIEIKQRLLKKCKSTILNSPCFISHFSIQQCDYSVVFVQRINSLGSNKQKTNSESLLYASQTVFTGQINLFST